MISKLILGLLWLAFVGLWIRVFQQVTAAAVIASLELLSLIAIGYVVLLGAWIGHNVAIFKAKGPRMGVRELGLYPAHDYLGVPVSIQVGLQTEQEIVVDVVNGSKCYRSAESRTDDLDALIMGVRESTDVITATEVDGS
jgi:hypothetical protein